MLKPGRGAQRCSCQCHWDLSWLRFGKGIISAGDVDGLFVVERRRHFLFIETKGPDELLSDGQKLLLTALSCVPKFTVLLLRGPKSYPESISVIRSGEWDFPESTDRIDFQKRVDTWYERADRV